jgi:hypothetical protein
MNVLRDPRQFLLWSQRQIEPTSLKERPAFDSSSEADPDVYLFVNRGAQSRHLLLLEAEKSCLNS